MIIAEYIVDCLESLAEPLNCPKMVVRTNTRKEQRGMLAREKVETTIIMPSCSEPSNIKRTTLCPGDRTMTTPLVKDKVTNTFPLFFDGIVRGLGNATIPSDPGKGSREQGVRDRVRDNERRGWRVKQSCFVS